MNQSNDTGNEGFASPEPTRRDEFTEVSFLETLIDKLIKRLDDESYKPRVQDALKAIQLKQKVAKNSESEKIFWDGIDQLRREELPKQYPDPNNLESVIKSTIFKLRFDVKNGVLPVKTITDTFNQSRTEETRLTYQRIGRLLTNLGFTKVKSSNGSSAILYDDNLLYEKKLYDDKKIEKQPPERSETPETPAEQNVIPFSMNNITQTKESVNQE